MNAIKINFEKIINDLTFSRFSLFGWRYECFDFKHVSKRHSSKLLVFVGRSQKQYIIRDDVSVNNFLIDIFRVYFWLLLKTNKTPIKPISWTSYLSTDKRIHFDKSTIYTYMFINLNQEENIDQLISPEIERINRWKWFRPKIYLYISFNNNVNHVLVVSEYH